MTRFEDEHYYRPGDPQLRLIAEVPTLAIWRHRGVGPPFTRFGRRILYFGRDLNEWLDAHRVEPRAA